MHFTQAATPIFIRTDGSDSECDGTLDVAYPGGAGPLPCAVQTIQKGVDLVDPGGTVEVAAGLYLENVIVSKSLTLLGAQRDVPPPAQLSVADLAARACFARLPACPIAATCSPCWRMV